MSWSVDLAHFKAFYVRERRPPKNGKHSTQHHVVLAVPGIHADEWFIEHAARNDDQFQLLSIDDQWLAEDAMLSAPLHLLPEHKANNYGTHKFFVNVLFVTAPRLPNDAVWDRVARSRDASSSAGTSRDASSDHRSLSTASTAAQSNEAATWRQIKASFFMRNQSPRHESSASDDDEGSAEEAEDDDARQTATTGKRSASRDSVQPKLRRADADADADADATVEE